MRRQPLIAETTSKGSPPRSSDGTPRPSLDARTRCMEPRGWAARSSPRKGVAARSPGGILNIPVEFEYDQKKSASNLRKHGIGFVEAQRLWADPDVVEIPTRGLDEPRSIVIGKIGDKHWAAVITSRAGRTRIISVRRAREEEVEIYESTGL